MGNSTKVPSLKKNVAYNFAYQLLALALPLVTAPYLSRIVGADGIGVYSYSEAVATYFVYFVMLGLNNYGNRTIAACQDSKSDRTKAFWSIYAMQAVCFVVSGSAYALYCVFVPGNHVAAILQGMFVVSALFDVNWFFFGMELFKLTVIRNTIVKIATTVLIFVLIKSPDDINLYIAIMSAGTLVSQVVLWPFLRRYIGFYRPRFKDVTQHIKPNLILFVSVIAISLYTTLTRILLGALGGGDAMVGYYDNASKIASVPVALISAIGTVMLPRTSALLAKGQDSVAARNMDKTMLVMMCFAGFAAFLIPCVAEPFVELFLGPGFVIAAQALIVLCARVPLLGFGNVMRTQYLIPHKMDSVFLVSAFCGAVASVVVGLILIPQLGAVGAGCASVAAEAAVLLYQSLRIGKGFPLARYLACTASYLGGGLVMMLAVMALLPQFDNLWLDCGANTLAAAVIYAVIAAPLTIMWAQYFKKKRVE